MCSIQETYEMENSLSISRENISVIFSNEFRLLCNKNVFITIGNTNDSIIKYNRDALTIRLTLVRVFSQM